MDVHTIKKINPTDIINSQQAAGEVKDIQTVVAVGDNVRGIKVGDVVCINPKRYEVMKHKPGSLQDGVIADNTRISYNWPTITLNGVDHLLIEDRDIAFVVEDYEEV